MNKVNYCQLTQIATGFNTFLTLTLCGAAMLIILVLGGTANAAEWHAFWVDGWGAGFLNQSQVSSLLGVPGTITGGTIRDANCNSVIVQVLSVLPASPSHIDSILMLADGSVQLSGSGEAGNYFIEASTNLLDWENLLVVPNTNGSFFWLEPVTNAPQRCYRAKHGP